MIRFLLFLVAIVSAIFASIPPQTNTPYAQVITESKANGTEIHYTYGNDLISDGTHYFLTDALGSIRGLVDSSESLTDSYDYKPYGELAIYTGSSTNSFLFTGEQFDQEANNYYLRARYYSPSLTRFLSRDTYDGKVSDPLSQNRYLYADGNPVNYVDPSGHFMMGFINTIRTLGSLAMTAMPRIVTVTVRPAIIGGSRALPKGATDVVVGKSRILGPSQMSYLLTLLRLTARTATEEGSPDKMPIQVYGTDKFLQHQNHINMAQMGLGSNQSAAAPSFLHRGSKQSRSFLRRNRECGRSSRGNNQCDEYPYSTTIEGGVKWADIWVSTMLVTNEERQGGFIEEFYRKSSIGIGDEFLVIPQGSITKYYDKYGIEHRY